MNLLEKIKYKLLNLYKIQSSLLKLYVCSYKQDFKDYMSTQILKQRWRWIFFLNSIIVLLHWFKSEIKFKRQIDFFFKLSSMLWISQRISIEYDDSSLTRHKNEKWITHKLILSIITIMMYVSLNFSFSYRNKIMFLWHENVKVFIQIEIHSVTDSVSLFSSII